MGREREYKQQMISELTGAFFDSWQTGMLACDAMRAAAARPCSRFWVTAECVYRRLRMGKRPRNRLGRAMLEEIERRLEGRRDIDSIEQVIAQPAPRFYIQPETARKLIQRELKRRKQCRKQRRTYAQQR